MMNVRFGANSSPMPEQLAALSRLAPHSPFSTPAYAAARAALGETPCVLGLYVGSDIIAGCVAFLCGGILSRRLEITTVPRLTHPTAFWDGVRGFCREQNVRELFVESFSSDIADIPSLPGELSRRTRYEFVLDLASPDLFAHMSANHCRNIVRARKAGLILQRTRDAKASQLHLRLIQASMERRKERGETISLPDDVCLLEALLQSGALID
jgi:hypothetical protein